MIRPVAAVRVLAASSLLLLFASSALARVALPPARPVHAAPGTIDYTGYMDAGNLGMYVSNVGSFGFNVGQTLPGLEYPKGSGKFALYAAGLWIGAKVNGTGPCVSVAEYSMEYGPGPMVNHGPSADQPAYRSYEITPDTLATDYLSWPSGQGAPLDSLGHPALSGDDMIWSVYNDADPTLHTNASGSTSPLGVEIQQSTYAWSRVGLLGNVIFLRYKILNKGMNQLDSMYVSIWADPDLGGFTDDLVGCDTTRSLAYCYNGTSNDPVYGTNLPAFGVLLMRGVATPTDTLCMTAFTKYVNGLDPQSFTETYNNMQGLHNDGSPMYVGDNPLQPTTRYACSGDPFLGRGWVDDSPGDRRFLMSTGPFSMAPGDSQDVVYAICIGQGSDPGSSVVAVQALADFLGGGCQSSRATTAISASLQDAIAEKDRVRLTWALGDGSGVTAEVFRSEAWSGPWTDLGPAVSDGSTLSFEDRTVLAGHRYLYRLALRDASGETTALESWIEVPGDATPSVPMLRVAGENPSGGDLRVSYAMPSGGPVRLEVFDVQGRRVAQLANAFAFSGWHEALWNSGSATSGLYFLRLTSRYGTLLRKAVIAR